MCISCCAIVILCDSTNTATVMEIMSHSWEKKRFRVTNKTNMIRDESLEIKRCHQEEEDAYFMGQDELGWWMEVMGGNRERVIKCTFIGQLVMMNWGK